MAIAVVVHCDWSMSAGKRWMAVAVREGEDWRIGAPEPVGSTAALFDRIGARRLEPGTILAGFDFPIGLPAAYGRRTGAADFRSLLTQLGTGRWASWFDVCEDQGQISVWRPFYPMRPGGRKLDHLTSGLDLSRDALLRECERPTSTRSAACCLFWTLGGNQVGKGAISGWRELLLPHLHEIAFWPFDGSLADLSRSHNIIVAETYPADVYGQIGLPAKKGWSKRTQEGRRNASIGLTNWLDHRPAVASDDLRRLISDGFSDKGFGEDQFDALVGLLGMLDVVDGRRDEGGPPGRTDKEWEGWILGQQTVTGSLP